MALRDVGGWVEVGLDSLSLTDSMILVHWGFLADVRAQRPHLWLKAVPACRYSLWPMRTVRTGASPAWMRAWRTSSPRGSSPRSCRKPWGWLQPSAGSQHASIPMHGGPAGHALGCLHPLCWLSAEEVLGKWHIVLQAPSGAELVSPWGCLHGHGGWERLRWWHLEVVMVVALGGRGSWWWWWHLARMARARIHDLGGIRENTALC